ncbi:MAG TPA: hypothetical protein VLI68_15225 [Hanamia sp.]|nr:hypothetical protein [Hanamia sp.]
MPFFSNQRQSGINKIAKRPPSVSGSKIAFAYISMLKLKKTMIKTSADLIKVDLCIKKEAGKLCHNKMWDA